MIKLKCYCIFSSGLIRKNFLRPNTSESIANIIFQPFLERRGDWTYCALAIRHLSQEDAGNYSVTVRNKHGEKTNHVRLSMKDPNAPQT